MLTYIILICQAFFNKTVKNIILFGQQYHTALKPKNGSTTRFVDVFLKKTSLLWQLLVQCAIAGVPPLTPAGETPAPRRQQQELLQRGGTSTSNCHKKLP
jgi:hypothetical protein